MVATALSWVGSSQDSVANSIVDSLVSRVEGRSLSAHPPVHSYKYSTRFTC